MGYLLYREVKIWAPEALTHREKLTAMVLADDANDTTRLSFHSVVDPEILGYAMVKNDRDMRKILARLQDEKVIEQAVAGHNGRIAKFRFLHLDPEGCPGEGVCGCPLAMAVQIGPPTDLTTNPDDTGVGGPERTANADPEDLALFQKEPPTEGVGGSNWHRRRSKKDRPTTPTSSTTTSSTAAKPARSRKPVVEKPAEHQVADDLTAAFWKVHGQGRTQPYVAVLKIVRSAISSGVERDDLARALDRVASEGSIATWKLDNALMAMKRSSGKPRGGARAPHPTHDEINSGSAVPNV